MRLALSLLFLLPTVLPTVSVGQDFRSAVIAETKKARQAGTITFRQAFQIRLAMRSPAKRAKIESEVVSDLWLSGKIEMSADGTPTEFSWADLDWEQLLRTIIQIIELINQLFGNTDAVPPDNPFDPISDAASAANEFPANFRSNLSANFAGVHQNMSVRPYNKQQLSSALTTAMDEAYQDSRREFESKAAISFDTTTDEQRRQQIGEFVKGFQK